MSEKSRHVNSMPTLFHPTGASRTTVLWSLRRDAGRSNYLFGGKEPVTLDDEADGYGLVRIAPGGRILYTASFKSGPVTYSIDQSGKQKKLLTEDAVIVATGF